VPEEDAERDGVKGGGKKGKTGEQGTHWKRGKGTGTGGGEEEKNGGDEGGPRLGPNPLSEAREPLSEGRHHHHHHHHQQCFWRGGLRWR
jgi:hypothetical protein